MKFLFIRNVLLLFVIACNPLLIEAQDPIRKTKKRTFRSIMVEKRTNMIKRKEDKKKWKEDRQVTMVTEKNVKKHKKRLQSKKTLKSMRRLKKKSKKMRSQ